MAGEGAEHQVEHKDSPTSSAQPEHAASTQLAGECEAQLRGRRLGEQQYRLLYVMCFSDKVDYTTEMTYRIFLIHYLCVLVDLSGRSYLNVLFQEQKNNHW